MSRGVASAVATTSAMVRMLATGRLGVHRANLGAHRPRQRQRIARRAHDDEHVANDVAAGDHVPLAVRHEELLLHDAGHAVVPLVGDDADTLTHGLSMLPTRIRPPTALPSRQ